MITLLPFFGLIALFAFFVGMTMLLDDADINHDR